MSLTQAAAIQSLIKGTVASLVPKVSITANLSGLSIANSASSDKVFSSASSSKTASNVFGVFDTKQAVAPLSGSTISNSSTEIIVKIPAVNLSNLANKVGMAIATDLQYQTAVNAVMDTVAAIKQMTLLNTVIIPAIAAVSDIVSIPIAYAEDVIDSIGNAAAAIVIPATVAIADFEAMKDLFNKPNGLGNYNSCSTVADALAYDSTVVDTTLLSQMLASLAKLLSKYDIGGILSCTTQAQQHLTPQQTLSLSSTLTSSGAVVATTDFYSNPRNLAVVENPCSVLQVLGQNRAVVYDPITLQPVNTFINSAVATAADGLCSVLGVVDKSLVFASNVVNATLNVSISDGVSDTIYDRDAIINTPNDNGFTDYCFGGNGNNTLISTVPDSLFA